jgi:hypothetical protein
MPVGGPLGVGRRYSPPAEIRCPAWCFGLTSCSVVYVKAFGPHTRKSLELGVPAGRYDDGGVFVDPWQVGEYPF